MYIFQNIMLYIINLYNFCIIFKKQQKNIDSEIKKEYKLWIQDL